MDKSIAVGVGLAIFMFTGLTMITGLSSVLADAWQKYNDIRERRIRLRIDRELSLHGLTSDMVLDALEGLDEFRFFMHGAECIARKGPDGHHQFMVIGQEELAEDVEDVGVTP